MPKVCVIIPTYNEAGTIGELLDRLESLGLELQVVVVDDGSTDGTIKIVEEASRRYGNIILMERGAKLGLGSALRDGLRKGLELGAELLVTMDADLQHDPQDVPQLIKPILQGEADVAFGVRRKDEMPFYRRLGNWLLDKIHHGEESQCGFRAYNWRALSRLDFEAEGFAVNGEIYRRVREDKDLKYVEVPVSTRYDEHSHSKSPVTHFLEIINFVFLRKPLRNLGLLGSTASVLGLLGIVEVVRRWSLYHELALGTFLAAVLLVILGAFTFYTGVILHLLTSHTKH